jgi:hypothetical protein
MISEELSGKELRAIAREYITTFSSLELLADTRQSSLFDIIAPDFKKSVSEVEEETSKLIKKLSKDRKLSNK